jgi:hypothetical protein
MAVGSTSSLRGCDVRHFSRLRPNLFETLRSVGTIGLVGQANVCRHMTEVAQRISSTA